MKSAVLLASFSLFLPSIPVHAHHAFATEFDGGRSIKLMGSVSALEWLNPHSWIHLDVKGADGKHVTWRIEAGGPNVLARMGFTKTSLAVGTVILVDGYQARNGGPEACGISVTFLDGKRLFLGSSAPDSQGGVD